MDVAIAHHRARDKHNRHRLAVSGGCPVLYDITDTDDAFGDTVSTAGFHSFLYALGYAWALYTESGDCYVLRTDGATTDVYLLRSGFDLFTSGKLVSDGTNVWAAISVNQEVEHPYHIIYDDACADIFCGGRSNHDDPTWDPQRLEVYLSSGGDFSLLGFVPAKFNNTGIGGAHNGFVGGVEGMASAQQEGVAFFVWSESGFTGTAIRSHGDVCAGGDGVTCCDDPSPLDLFDRCRVQGPPHEDPDNNPLVILPGAVPDAFPRLVGDWNWFGERFVVAICDTSSVTESEPVIYMKSAQTTSSGDQFGDDGGVFSPTAIVPRGKIMAVNDDPMLAALFTIWPVSTEHTFETQVYGTEVTMRDLSTTVLQTLDVFGSIASPGATTIGLIDGSDLSISRAAWLDPVDGEIVYYVGSEWDQDVGTVADVHRIATDGGSAFEPLDLVSTRTPSGGALNQPGTLMPETWNNWFFRNGTTSGRRYERHCPKGWTSDGPSHVPTTYETFLVDDAIYYASFTGPGVRKLCLCRLCDICPGETFPLMSESPFTDDAEFCTDQEAVNWAVRSCSPSIATVEFIVDDEVVCTATNPVGSIFYYCDSAPGTFDVGALSVGDHDLEWRGYSLCGSLVWIDAVTISVSTCSEESGVVFKVDGVTIATLPTDATEVRLFSLRTGGDPSHWFDNVKIGTTGYGSSDIFSDDFASGDFSAWSGISDPASLFSVSGGRAHASGSGTPAQLYFDITPDQTLPVYIRFELEVAQAEIDTDNANYCDWSIDGFATGGGIYLYAGSLGVFTDLDFLDCDISCPYPLTDGEVITIDIGIFG